MSKKIKIIFALILLIVLVYGILFSPLTLIDKVEVSNIGQVNSNFDESLLEINDNFFLFSEASFNEKILATGLVESMKIQKKFPNTVHLELTWKTPLIAIKSAERNIIIDKNGYVLYIDNESMNLDIIEGVTVKFSKIGEVIKTTNDMVFENAVNLYLLVQANRELFVPELSLSNIVIYNDKIIQNIGEYFDIYYGDGSELDDKFSKAIAIYNELSKKEVNSGIINVSRKDQYIYETWKPIQ